MRHLDVEISATKYHAVEPSELVLGVDGHNHPANSSDVHVKFHLQIVVNLNLLALNELSIEFLIYLPFPSGWRGVRRVVSEAPDKTKVGREKPRVKHVLIAELLVGYHTKMTMKVEYACQLLGSWHCIHVPVCHFVCDVVEHGPQWVQHFCIVLEAPGANAGPSPWANREGGIVQHC